MAVDVAHGSLHLLVVFTVEVGGLLVQDVDDSSAGLVPGGLSTPELLTDVA